jgi:hypothetical protein
MAKKRTSLDSILAPAARQPEPQPVPPLTSAPAAARHEGRRPEVKQQTVYLPIKVHEQLRRLAFDERARMHDYLLEGLDLVFRARGLRSIAELTGRPREPEEG